MKKCTNLIFHPILRRYYDSCFCRAIKAEKNNFNGEDTMTTIEKSGRKIRPLAIAAILVCAAITLTITVPVQAATVLDGKTIRILAIGDPVFQVMQKIHGDLESMAGGKIELDVKPFDVLRQQVLLNSRNSVSNYDLIAVDLPQFGEYKSFLRSLNGLIADHKFDTKDFHKVAWDSAQFSNQQLGIPIQPHPQILAYRKDLFAKAGLNPPKTTEDVLAAAKALHGSEAGMSGICWNAARGTALGQTFIMDEGGFGQAPINLDKSGEGFSMGDIQPANMKPMIDTPAGLATAKYLKGLMKYSPPGILNMAWDERVRIFAQGGCAMTYIWSGRSAIYELDESSPARGNVGYVAAPGGNGAPQVSTLGGWYFSIPKNVEEDRVELAWSVIEWMTSSEMMAEYTKHGNCVAPRHSVSADAEVIARCPVIPFVDAMDVNGLIAGWQRPPVPEIQKIVDILGSEMHMMLAGEVTPEKAVKKSQKLIDKEMRKAGYY